MERKVVASLENFWKKKVKKLNFVQLQNFGFIRIINEAFNCEVRLHRKRRCDKNVKNILNFIFITISIDGLSFRNFCYKLAFTKNLFSHLSSSIKPSMRSAQIWQLLIIVCVMRQSESGVSISAQNFTSKCDSRHGDIVFYEPTRPGYIGAMKISVFHDFRNVNLRCVLRVSGSEINFFDVSVSLCSSASRGRNIFSRRFSEFFFSSMSNQKDFGCPVKKGVFEFAEKSPQNITDSLHKYLPAFVRLNGKIFANFKIFYEEKSQKVDICETNEIWAFKNI